MLYVLEVTISFTRLINEEVVAHLSFPNFSVEGHGTRGQAFWNNVVYFDRPMPYLTCKICVVCLHTNNL